MTVRTHFRIFILCASHYLLSLCNMVVHFYAAARNHLACLCICLSDKRTIGRRQLLLTFSVLIGTQDQERTTALMEAAVYGHTECVRLLLEAGAKANAKTNVRQNHSSLHVIVVCLDC